MKKEGKKKSRVRVIIDYVISFLSLFLCIYIVAEVVIANTNGRPPRIFNMSVSYVPTGSMEPTIHTGDYVMFTSVDYKDVHEGDIIVYKSNKNNMFIIHRVVDKNDTYITTQGDNAVTNPVPDDEEVLPEMVLGRYVTTLGFMKIFTGGINQNLVFFILMGVFFIMVIMQIISIVIKKKTEDLKKDIETQKKELREEMKKQILEEELARLREENRKKLENKTIDNDKEESE